MNTYELTIVLREDKEGKESARIIKVVTDFAKKTKGEVNKQESWGAKHLAYPIKKVAIGQYEHFVVTLEPSSQIVLDKTLHMDESILRYMFVRV
ncbi:MAG: 30S ribosomal protein S6 [bacterium]